MDKHATALRALANLLLAIASAIEAISEIKKLVLSQKENGDEA